MFDSLFSVSLFAEEGQRGRQVYSEDVSFIPGAFLPNNLHPFLLLASAICVCLCEYGRKVILFPLNRLFLLF